MMRIIERKDVVGSVPKLETGSEAWGAPPLRGSQTSSPDDSNFLTAVYRELVWWGASRGKLRRQVCGAALPPTKSRHQHRAQKCISERGVIWLPLKGGAPQASCAESHSEACA